MEPVPSQPAEAGPASAEAPGAEEAAEAQPNPISADPPGTADTDQLLPKEGYAGVPLEEWYRRALLVAAVSAGYNSAVFLVGIIGAIATDSSSLLSMALEAMADVLGDLLVMWRFSGDPNDPMVERYDSQASVLIAFVMSMSCVIVVTGAVRHLVHHKPPKTHVWILYVHGLILVVSTVLTGLKLWIAKAVKSRVLMLDAITGGVVAVLSLAYIISAELTIHDVDDAWFVDSAVALIASAFILYMAASTLRMYPWLNMEFWSVFNNVGDTQATKNL